MEEKDILINNMNTNCTMYYQKNAPWGFLYDNKLAVFSRFHSLPSFCFDNILILIQLFVGRSS